MNTDLKRKRFLIPLPNLSFYVLFIVGLTTLLFYVDEGYYSFAWMTNLGAWFVFSLYTFIFLLIILLIDAFTFRSLYNCKKVFASLSIFFLLLVGFLFFTAI